MLANATISFTQDQTRVVWRARGLLDDVWIDDARDLETHALLPIDPVQGGLDFGDEGFGDSFGDQHIGSQDAILDKPDQPESSIPRHSDVRQRMR